MIIFIEEPAPSNGKTAKIWLFLVIPRHQHKRMSTRVGVWRHDRNLQKQSSHHVQQLCAYSIL